MRGQAPLLLVVSLAAGGLATVVVQSKVIPDGPAWAVAIVLILGGLVALGHVVVKLVKVSRGNGERVGTRRSDDFQIDRSEMEREIEKETSKLRLIMHTHEMVEALSLERADVKAILAKITDMLAHAQEIAAIQAGTMEQLIRNQMQIEVALVKQGERLEHVPTKAEFMVEHEHTRHALRNDGSILAGGGKLPSTIR